MYFANSMGILLCIWPDQGLCFKGGNSFMEESRDTKCESLFHVLSCHNQMDNMHAEKD